MLSKGCGPMLSLLSSLGFVVVMLQKMLIIYMVVLVSGWVLLSLPLSGNCLYLVFLTHLDYLILLYCIRNKAICGPNVFTLFV
jgi:hypothetical protein